MMATTAGAPEQTTRFTEDFGEGNRYDSNNNSGSNSTKEEERPDTANTSENEKLNTLKKGDSVHRRISIRKSGSKKGQNDYSEKLKEESEDPNSALVSPVPTQVNPTEILAQRFSNWRRVLKEFATFFKEVAAQYEARAKSMSRVQSCLNTTLVGDTFLSPEGGLCATHKLLSSFHADQRVAAENARQIELQIVSQLNAVRHDLGLKVKEIKSLSGDFKSNVDKEKEATRKSIVAYLDALSSDSEAGTKQDPYLVKLSVERQIRKLLTEENYLHRAFLNIESSGRELESIIVKEIQKAFYTYGEIIKNEGLTNVNFNTSLEMINIQTAPDSEWIHFISNNSNFVTPGSRLRTLDMIHYPGHDSPATTEIRSGPLERKSKYLKSFSSGWFVLSPTYLHEFKSPDRIADPQPVMSLYLPDSQIGSHSDEHAVNHKFMLKGKQSGGMHIGHTWVFRAASYEIMMKWYEDIRKLTELSGSDRDQFVGRRRTLSLSSKGPGGRTIEEEDEEDRSLMADEEDVPYSAANIGSVLASEPHYEELSPPKRPEAGRFGSDMAITTVGDGARYESNSSEEAIAGVHALPGESVAYAENRPSSRASSNWSNDQRNQQYTTATQTFVPVTNATYPAETTPDSGYAQGDQQPATLPPQQSQPIENTEQQYPPPPQDPSTATNILDPTTSVFIPADPSSTTSAARQGNNTTPSSHPITDPEHNGDVNKDEVEAPPALNKTERPPNTPMPQGRSQSTLENIHFPGEYPKTPMEGDKQVG